MIVKDLEKIAAFRWGVNRFVCADGTNTIYHWQSKKIIKKSIEDGIDFVFRYVSEDGDFYYFPWEFENKIVENVLYDEKNKQFLVYLEEE